jgi:hypothetical protein
MLTFSQPLDPNSVFSLASQFIVSCPPSNPPLPFSAFPSLAVDATPCFNEVSGLGQGGFSTASIDWATVVSNVEAATTTALDLNATATATESLTTSTETAVTTEAAVASETTAEATATATETSVTETTTTETAAATETPAAEKRNALEARTFQNNCQATFGGSQISLKPDFSSSHGFDFRRQNQIFVTIISGLDVISIAAQFSGDGSIQVIIPPSVQGGQIFIFITAVDFSGRQFNPSQVMFGPAAFERKCGGGLPHFEHTH